MSSLVYVFVVAYRNKRAEDQASSGNIWFSGSYYGQVKVAFNTDVKWTFFKEHRPYWIYV